MFSNPTVFLFSSRILSEWHLSALIDECDITLLLFIQHTVIDYYYVLIPMLSTKEIHKAGFQPK